MAFSMTVPVIAALSLVGAGAGLQLGRSAIAEINPVYYSEQPAQTFFADLTPAGYRPSADALSEPADIWAAQSIVSGRPACSHCNANLVDPLYAAPAARPEPTAEAGVEIQPIEIRPIPQQQLERYSSFPVTEEEARAQAVRTVPDHDYASMAPAAAAPAATSDGEPDGL